MPETVSQLVTEIREEGSFDVTSATALRWLDRRHRMMCARARCYRKAAVVVGGTVVDQTAYTQPAGLVEALEVTVGGLTYTRGRHTDLAAVAQDELSFEGDGFFVPTWSAAGVAQIALIPTPSEAALVIEVFGAYTPPALLIDNTVPLQIDDEAEEGLLAGVFATALGRPSESRSDLAEPHEQAFAAACDALRLRVQKRLRGSGPTQIRVSGLNA